MEIVVHNFRCYGQAAAHSFQFKRGAITLIEGPSGIGKSTVLQAIYWNLYGKLRNITPKKSKKHSRTEVSLRLGNIVVRRETRPNKLQVIIDDEETLHDDVAQAYIDNVFGSRDMWRSTSYLGQKTICELLYSSTSGRIEILNNLVFKGQYGPDEYIQKIVDKITEEKIKLNELISLHSSRIKDLENKLRTIIIPPEQRDLEAIQAEVEEYGKFLQDNSKLYEQEKHKLIEYQLLGKQLEEVMAKFGDYDLSSVEESIAQAEQNLARWGQYEQIISDMNQYNISQDEIISGGSYPQVDESKLKEQMASLQKTINHNIDYRSLEEEIKYYRRVCDENGDLEQELDRSTQQLEIIKVVIDKMEKNNQRQRRRLELLSIIGEISTDEIVPIDIGAMTEEWSKYRRYKDIAAGLGIKYTPKSLQQYSTMLGEKLENARRHNGYMEVVRKIQKLQEELVGMGEEIDYSLTREELFAMQQQKRDSERALICPNCQAPLILDQNNLHLPNDVIPQEEISSFNQYFQYYQNELPRTERARRLNEDIEQLWEQIPENFIPGPEVDTDSIVQSIGIIDQVKYINSPKYTIEQYIAIDELSRIGSDEIIEMDFAETSVEDLRLRRDKLLVDRGLYEDRIKNYNNAQNRLEELGVELKLLEDHKKNSDMIEELNHQLRSSRLGWICQNWVERPEEEKEFYIDMLKEKKPLMQRLLNLNHEKSNLEERIGLMNVADEFLQQYEETEELLSRSEEVYKEEMYWNQLRSERAELEEKVCRLEESRSVVEKLERLKTKAIDVQTKYLESTVGNLIVHINSILEEIFDDPINIHISLTHTVKKTQSIISGVDITINYKGGVHESVSELSGGEVDRLSLAFVLALQRIHNNQILLLDETMSSLDFNMRTRCMNFIRQTATMRQLIVVMINHEDTGGSIDQTIILD